MSIRDAVTQYRKNDQVETMCQSGYKAMGFRAWSELCNSAVGHWSIVWKLVKSRTNSSAHCVIIAGNGALFGTRCGVTVRLWIRPECK